MTQEITAAEVAKWLSELTAREQVVARAYFGIESCKVSVAEIAKSQNLSTQMIYVILSKVKRKVAFRNNSREVIRD